MATAGRGQGAHLHAPDRRERGYHGDWRHFPWAASGGNRKTSGPCCRDHLPHATWKEKNAYTVGGAAEYGTHTADELERIVALHDTSWLPPSSSDR
jgi:beta-alanine--pyruvate transaminase